MKIFNYAYDLVFFYIIRISHKDRHPDGSTYRFAESHDPDSLLVENDFMIPALIYPFPLKHIQLECFGKIVVSRDNIEGGLFAGRFTRPFHQCDHLIKFGIVAGFKSGSRDIYNLRYRFQSIDQSGPYSLLDMGKQTGQLDDTIAVEP